MLDIKQVFKTNEVELKKKREYEERLNTQSYMESC